MKKIRIDRLLAVGAVLAAVSLSFGETVEVAVGDSIKAAIEGVTAGQTILIKAGTHTAETRSVTVPKVAFTLQGEDGAVIDGSNMTSGDYFLKFTASSTAAICITNLVFQKFVKGVAQEPGGCANVSFLGCAFNGNGDSENGPERGGALLFAEHSQALVRGCSFSNNKSTIYGGAIYTVGSKPNESLIFEDCVFTNHNTSCKGGAVFLSYGGNQQLIHCLFRDNDAAGTNQVCAAEFYLNQNSSDSSHGTIILTNCTIAGVHTLTFRTNTTYGIVFNSIKAKIVDSTFTGIIRTQAASDEYSIKYGLYGALGNVGGTTFENCTISNVTYAADDYIKTNKKSYYGFLFASSSTMNVSGCRFVDNDYGSDHALLSYNTTTTRGYVRNSLFLRNASSAAIGFISHRTYNANDILEVDNCTILHSGKKVVRANDASDYGHFIFRNSILVGSRDTANFTYAITNCVTSVADSDFVCAGRDNYIPVSTSETLVNQGLTLDWYDASAVDLGGRPRVVGTAADIGCYEHQTTDADYTLIRAVPTAADKMGEWADAIVGAKAAIDSATGYEHVYLKNGTYPIDSTLVISNMDLTVEGETKGGVILDGQGRTRVMFVHHGPHNTSTWIPSANHIVTLKNLVFTNGLTTAGDGLPCSGVGGGLVYFGGAKASGGNPGLVKDCAFYDCHATSGGAIGFFAGKYEGCTFANNVATTSTAVALIDAADTKNKKNGVGGAAVSLTILYDTARPSVAATDDASLYRLTWFDNCTFTNNTAYQAGGTLSTGGREGYSSAFRMSNCRVFDSILTTAAGANRFGLMLNGLYQAYVTNCVFRQFAAPSSQGGYGGIIAAGSTLIVDSEFNAINISYGAVDGRGTGVTVVDRCKFLNGPYCDIAESVDVRNSLFARTNSAGHSYMSYQHSKTSNFDNCTFVLNGGYLSQIHESFTNLVVNFRNTLIWNQGTPAKGLIYNQQLGNAKISFTNTLFPAAPTFSEYVTNVNAFVSSHPCFRDPANGDYSIRHGSPARDRGAKLSWMGAGSVDMAGNPRVVKDGVASEDALPDLGCYENGDEPHPFIIHLR